MGTSITEMTYPPEAIMYACYLGVAFNTLIKSPFVWNTEARRGAEDPFEKGGPALRSVAPAQRANQRPVTVSGRVST